MNIIKAIGKGIKTISDELNKPESFSKGEAFEEYIRQYTFPKERFDLIHKTHNYQANKEDYVESSLYPDFKLRCKETSKVFYLEVKFRQGAYHKNKIEWSKPYQLKRYKAIAEEGIPIFLALGLGDNPKKPTEIFIIPIDKIEFCAFYDSFLDKYSFYIDKPVFSSYLWKL